MRRRDPMARSTGLPSADAQDDFLRVRRRGQLSRLATFLRREPDDVNLVLPYDEVVRALGRVEERELGVQTIPLDSIVGSVYRRREFDRAFRPTSSQVRARWERIAAARRRGEAMPPVDVIRVGEVHFVRDGHLRVSVAMALGESEIDANVTEILTRVGMDRSIRMADLPLKSQERLFHERVPLPAEARRQIRLTEPQDFGRLAEAVEAWGFRLIQHDREFCDREELGRRWFREEYEPAVTLLREAGLLEGFATETEGYLRRAESRWQLLQSQEWTGEAIDRLREER